MKIGDKVSVIDDVISGDIVAIDQDKVTILSTEGFEIQYTKNELVITSNFLSKEEIIPLNISEIISEKETNKKSKSKRIKPKKRSLPPMVVDLHIHQLVSKTKGLNNYDMLTLQLETVKRQLEFAFRKKIQRIVFIHGVGEGVLREELNYLFKRYENLKFYDADFQKYGSGATEVYIFQNKTP